MGHPVLDADYFNFFKEELHEELSDASIDPRLTKFVVVIAVDGLMDA